MELNELNFSYLNENQETPLHGQCLTVLIRVGILYGTDIGGHEHS